MVLQDTRPCISVSGFTWAYHGGAGVTLYCQAS